VKAFASREEKILDIAQFIYTYLHLERERDFYISGGKWKIELSAADDDDDVAELAKVLFEKFYKYVW
jgi:hypothetical protein